MAKRTRGRRLQSRQDKEICQQITDLILDYLTEELDPKTRSDFEAHLHICPDCVAFLNTYKKTFQATRSLRYEDIPSEMERRVRLFLEERIKKGRRGR